MYKHRGCFCLQSHSIIVYRCFPGKARVSAVRCGAHRCGNGTSGDGRQCRSCTGTFRQGSAELSYRVDPIRRTSRSNFHSEGCANGVFNQPEFTLAESVRKSPESLLGAVPSACTMFCPQSYQEVFGGRRNGLTGLICKSPRMCPAVSARAYVVILL